MKKAIILQLILIFCSLFNVLAANSLAKSENISGASPLSQDFIVIVDLMGIGTGAQQDYTNVCPNNSGTPIISGQTIPLAQANSNDTHVDAERIGFHPSMLSYGNFVSFHAWIGCSGELVLADIQLFGAMQQQNIINSQTGQLIEVRFFIPNSASEIRVSQVPGGLKAIMTLAEGTRCTYQYINPCYGPASPREDNQGSDASEEVTVASLTVQPNPVQDVLTTYLTLAQTGEVKVSLVDLTGRQVRTLQFTATEGEHTFQVDTDAIPVGLYVLLVQTPDGNLTEKIIKQ